MKYRKKPVVIDAVRVNDLLGNRSSIPPWAGNAIRTGDVSFSGEHLYIKTLEGVMSATLDDWLIRGVKGELYACKPDIFQQTYEPVDNHADG